MIVVQLQGGLGNQMFQYAFGKAMAEKHQLPLYLDLSFLQKKAQGYTQRNYALDIFQHHAQIASPEIIHSFEKARANDILSKIKRKISPSPYTTHHERGFAYQPFSFLEKNANRYIGFFQSEKYFLPYRKQIMEAFQFPIDAFDVANTMRERIKNCDAISVHIRRGDYITDKNANQFHGTCDNDYYYNAIRTISKGLENPQLFIFSDETDWVKNNMQFELPCHYIDFNTGVRSHYDMEMMSLCKHHIIANSSFSWWGAWLNNNANKKVIAPRQWFNDQRIDTKDLIPEEWQKM